MKRLILMLSVLLALLPMRASSWDGVTHRHITDLAIAEVRDPELKAFLLAHRDALLSGADFPDWGHALKPHGEQTHAAFLDAGLKDLMRSGRAESDRGRWLAYYLGAYGHVVEDRLLDATLKRRAPEIGEAHRDDMENGILMIADQRLFVRDHNPVTPAADLTRVYAASGFFGETRLNAGNLADQMRMAEAHENKVTQQLKLLSFLAAGELRRVYPWGAAHLIDAPGGVQSNARAVAAGWEALWAQLHGRPSVFFTYITPEPGGALPVLDNGSPYGRITVITRQRMDVRKLDAEQVTLRDSQGRRIPVSVHPYIDEPDHEVDIAFQIEATQPWRPGEIYSLEIAPGPYAEIDAGAIEPLRLRFGATAHPAYANRLNAPRPWAMGLFLFVLIGGGAGLVFGAPDLLKIFPGRHAESLWCKGLNVSLKIIGLSGFVLALWLLWTNGAAVVSWLHFNH